MSIRGFFEIDPAGEPEALVARVREMGFPCAEIEKVEGFKKAYLVDLQAFCRPDAGGGNSVREDLVRVAKFLIEHSRDNVVYYSQDLDIRNPDNTKAIRPEDIGAYPPSMDGCVMLFLVRS